MRFELRHELNALGRSALVATPFEPTDSEKAKSEALRVRQTRIDEGLVALGITPHHPDEYGRTNGEPHAWHTAQLVDGRIVGRWSGSPEQALAELAASWRAYVGWCVEDYDRDRSPVSPLMEQLSRKYAVKREQGPVVAPFTQEPPAIEAPAPREATLFDLLEGWAA